MALKTLEMTDTVYAYYQQHAFEDHPILAECRERTKTFIGAQMQIAPEQGQLLAWLVKTLNAKSVLEIGTFTGYSAMAMALALPNDGHVTTCDINPASTKVAQDFWLKANLQDKITSRVGRAHVSLQALVDEGAQFDFAFLDADKVHYDDYYEFCLILLRQGGVLAVDNVLMNGEVAHLENDDRNVSAVRVFNEKVKHDKRVSFCMLPMSDGITLITKLALE